MVVIYPAGSIIGRKKDNKKFCIIGRIHWERCCFWIILQYWDSAVEPPRAGWFFDGENPWNWKNWPIGRLTFTKGQKWSRIKPDRSERTWRYKWLCWNLFSSFYWPNVVYWKRGGSYRLPSPLFGAYLCLLIIQVSPDRKNDGNEGKHFQHVVEKLIENW